MLNALCGKILLLNNWLIANYKHCKTMTKLKTRMANNNKNKCYIVPKF